MQNLPEGLTYFLVLALAYLASYLFKRFAPQQLEPAPPPAEIVEENIAQEPLPVGAATALIAPSAPLPARSFAATKPMLSDPPRGSFSRRALMGSKQNKQAAIAMATILGPCRAFEPAGNQASSGS